MNDKTNLEGLMDYHPDHDSHDLSDISDNENPISVTECIRMHSGDMVVKGTIASISRLYKMIKSVTIVCPNCGVNRHIPYPIPILEPPNNLSTFKECKGHLSNMEIKIGYVNSVKIYLQDSDTFSEIEKLFCILFDENILIYKLAPRS
jgi:hypothetical protein